MLFALLCVGDTIKRIWRITSRYINYANVRESCYQIENTAVTAIHKDMVIEVIRSGFKLIIPTPQIDTYNGKLYFWGSLDKFQTYTPEKRLKKMIEIIESARTKQFSEYATRKLL